MLKKKNDSKNDSVNFYYSCVLFKKYDQYNLWFGDFGEYNNIKYCKKYIQKYIYCWISIFLLQHFSPSFVIVLYKNPRFIKFVDSGFFKHLNYHFLLTFYNNRFSFNSEGKKQIRVFVISYFQIFLKRHLGKDLLFLLIKVINEIILDVLLKHLNKSLKDIEIYAGRSFLNYKNAFEPIQVSNNERVYFVGLFYFNHLTKKTHCKSYYAGSTIFYTIKSFYSFAILKNIYKSSLKVEGLKDTKVIKDSLKSIKLSKKIMEETFIKFAGKILGHSNKDIQYLLEFVELLEGSNGYLKNIGLYKNTSLLSKKHSVGKKKFKGYKFFLKSFNTVFAKYKHKKIYGPGFLVSCNLKFFSEHHRTIFKSTFKKKSIINNKKTSSSIKKTLMLQYKDNLKQNNKIYYNICDASIKSLKTSKYFLIEPN